ncbi:MAG: isopropylmalate/homocitrate/citramalate synthase, partial [Oceanicoccus sp.]
MYVPATVKRFIDRNRKTMETIAPEKVGLSTERLTRVSQW